MLRITCRRFALAAGAALALSVTVAAVAGDTYYFEQTSSSSGMGQPKSDSMSRMWLSDTAVRTEDDSSVTIVRSDTGSVYILMPSEKTYTEMSLEQVKSMAAMGSAMLDQSGSQKPSAKVVETGKSRKIAGYDSDEVIVTIVGGAMPMQLTLWLTQDLDVDMSAWMRMAGGMGLQTLMGDAVDQIAKLGGYPLRQETKATLMGMEITSTDEVTKVEKRDADASLFAIPPGYEKAETIFLPAPAN